MSEPARDASRGDEEIKQQFRVRRARQFLAMIPLVPAMLVAGYSGKTGPGVTVEGVRLLPYAVLVVVVVLLFSFWNWRCPACRGSLATVLNPKRCPQCGVELR